MAAGDPRVVSRVDAALAAMDAGGRRFANMAGVAYVGRVQRLMRSSPASGRVYRRRRATVGAARRAAAGERLRAADFITHRASAPGEPPAVDRGNLVNSVAYEEQLTDRGWAAIGGSTLARIPSALEFGTRDGRIAPRPAFLPAVLQLQPDLERIARAAYREAGA